MMLMIQGAANANYLSLSERMTLASGYHFLIRFISEDNLVETTSIPVVVSGTTAYRYHKLTITEKDNATSSERQAGSITLDPYGTFLYQVYQRSASLDAPTNASATLYFIALPTQSDTFTITIPAVGSTPAYTIFFTFTLTAITDTEIQIGSTITQQGFFFAQKVGTYLQLNHPGLFLSGDPNPQTKQQFLASGIYGGAAGNGIVLSWLFNHGVNPNVLSLTEGGPTAVSPLSLSGGSDGIGLDIVGSDVLLEQGKCLVTKLAGFDATKEYTGATSVTKTYSG